MSTKLQRSSVCWRSGSIFVLPSIVDGLSGVEELGGTLFSFADKSTQETIAWNCFAA